jgi:hypothetical protein
MPYVSFIYLQLIAKWGTLGLQTLQTALQMLFNFLEKFIYKPFIYWQFNDDASCSDDTEISD